MNKKLLSLLIAGFLITGIGFNAASFAAPHRDHGVRKEVRHQNPPKKDFRAKRDNSRFDSHKEHKKEVKKFQKNQKKEIKSFKKQNKNMHKAPAKRPQAKNHRPARRR